MTVAFTFEALSPPPMRHFFKAGRKTRALRHPAVRPFNRHKKRQAPENFRTRREVTLQRRTKSRGCTAT